MIADRLFGFEISRREWVGVAVTAVGLALLAATLGDTGKSAHDEWEVAMLTLYCGGLTAASLVAIVVVRGDPAHAGPILALAAGLLWGASDVAIKALSGRLDDLAGMVLLHPLALVILTLSLVGLVVSARSLQLGPAVAVIAITSAAANVVTIAAGPIVFGEPMPDVRRRRGAAHPGLRARVPGRRADAAAAGARGRARLVARAPNSRPRSWCPGPGGSKTISSDLDAVELADELPRICSRPGARSGRRHRQGEGDEHFPWSSRSTS